MKKTWSRKKLFDEFTGMLKADGSPMSRQQIHMLRKKARGICMICAEPAVGVYCLKHTIAVRERMRKKLKYRRRLLKSASYVAKNGAKPASKTKPAKAPVKANVKASVKAPVKANVKAPVKANVKASAKAPARKAAKPAAKGKAKR